MPDRRDDFLELGRRAVDAPLAMALAAPGRQPLSSAALWNHVREFSDRLQAVGVAEWDVAAVALPNGAELLTSILAITLRCACAPLDLSWTADELRSYLRRVSASTLVFEEGSTAPAAGIARELGMRLVPIRTLPDAPAGLFETAAIEPATGDRETRRLDAKLLLHTSATTDVPKLVPRSRAGVLAAAWQDVRALELSSSDRYLSLIPLNLGHALTMIFSQLICGGSVFCAPAFESAGFMEALASFRPTWFAGGPSISRALLAMAREDARVFRQSTLRFVCSLGAAPEPDLVPALENLLGVPVLENYGMTEASGVTRNTLTMRRAGSVGRSTGAEIAIVDERDNPLPAGSEGEVVVRGPTLMSGYIDNPEANAAAFLDGWFRTGDIGRMDEDGFLFIVGRRKEMISRGGQKIAPQEVDDALAIHPGVAEVAAFAVPHRTLVEEVAAAVVLRAGASVPEQELRSFAARRLAAYKVPRRIVFVESIPRSGIGKPKRAALREQFSKLAEPGQAAAARPLTRKEEQLAAIWRRILGIEKIGSSDSFFDLGGDSLLAGVMLAEAAAWIGGARELPEADFFRDPTLMALAGQLEQHGRSQRGGVALQNRILVLQGGGGRVPFFCFSTSESDAYQFRHLAEQLGPDQPFTVICPAHPVQQNRALALEEVASQTVATIRTLYPHGAYVLGGHCYGGVVAFEAARQLRAAGEQVRLVVLFEVPTPGFPRILSRWRAFSHALAGAWSRIVRRSARQSVSLDSWNRTLMEQYRPRLLNAPVVHFVGADVVMTTLILNDPRLGWRHFAAGGFEAHNVPGDHVSILSESKSPALAAELEPLLREINAERRVKAAAGP